MTGFWQGPALAVDLETSGTNVFEDRIVTACAAIVEDGKVAFQREWLLAVEVDIPEAATAVHGISTAHAREHGIPVAQGVKEIATAVQYAVHSGYPLILFNAAFDLSMLNAECVRNGLGTLEEFCGRPIGPVLDGLVLDKVTHRYRKGSRKLGDVCTHFGIVLENAHTAGADALAAAEVVRVIAERSVMDAGALRHLYADERYPDSMVRSFHALGGMTAGQIHQASIGWYREQAQGLGEYWAQQRLQRLAEADQPVPPALPELPDASDDERRQVLREQAEELAEKIASLRFSWPIEVAP